MNTETFCLKQYNLVCQWNVPSVLAPPRGDSQTSSCDQWQQSVEQKNVLTNEDSGLRKRSPWRAELLACFYRNDLTKGIFEL